MRKRELRGDVRARAKNNFPKFIFHRNIVFDNAVGFLIVAGYCTILIHSKIKQTKYQFIH